MSNVLEMKSRQNVDQKLGTAFKNLETDIYDLENMAQLTALHAEDWTNGLMRGEKPDRKSVELIMFAIYQTLDRAKRLSRDWTDQFDSARVS